MKMSVVHWWNDTDGGAGGGESVVLGEKPVPLPHCPP